MAREASAPNREIEIRHAPKRSVDLSSKTLLFSVDASGNQCYPTLNAHFASGRGAAEVGAGLAPGCAGSVGRGGSADSGARSGIP